MDLSEKLKTSSSYYYEVQKFKESESDTSDFEKASLKRTLFSLYSCPSQIGKISRSPASNQDACYLLKENLRQYSELVDDKNSVNNYAEHIQALSKNIKNDRRSKWKSSLTNKHFSLCTSETINGQPNRELSCVDSGCEATQSDISNFLKLARVKVEEMTLNEPDENQIIGRDKKVLFATNTNNKRKIDTHFSDLNEAKTMRTEETTPKFRKANISPHGCHLFSNSDSQRQFNRSNFGQSVNRQSSECAVSTSSQSVLRQQQEQQHKQRGPGFCFRTASDELRKQNLKKHGSEGARVGQSSNRIGDDTGGFVKKSLGGRSRSVTNKFIPPIQNSDSQGMYDEPRSDSSQENPEEDERLKHIDKKMVELIRSEIMENGIPIAWDDIAGLQFAKKTIQEIVVWPMLRPDIFTGLRRPPKGILLFGPPGTGKTLIGKCIASQSKSTFFSISASSLTSKWIGDGEKMVRALFAVARVHQPSVVFIDEIDSLLSKRSDSEHESSRRIKTEFLVQLDGATTGDEDRILVVGATNRPQELDEAARRRLVKRLYIPLPDYNARKEIVSRLMRKERNDLTPEEINEVAQLTDGYSGADVRNVCQEAALGPIRVISFSQIEHIAHDQVQPIKMDHFKTALNRVRSSVSPDDLVSYLEWDKTYGSGSL